MSYFGSEKKINLSVSAIQSGVTQTISTTLLTVNVFEGLSATPITSSIGYPIVSVSSNIFTLEAGWKYCIDLKMKHSVASTSTAINYLIYYMTDTSGAQISSIGRSIIYVDNRADFAQEKCIKYFDATAGQQQFMIKAQRGNVTDLVINSSRDTQTTNFRSYILIKAWK
jgi:hypothetical protein